MNERRPGKPWTSEWRRYIRFWGRDVDRDIADEVRFHLEMREQDFLARGHAPHEAHDAALARFGSVHAVTDALRTHDIRKHQHERRVEFMDNLAQDVRYGARKLVQAPGFSASVILILALGIGINTAIFSAVDAAILRPLPFKDSERLALLSNVNLPSEMRVNGVPRPKQSPDITDVLAMTDVVQELGAYTTGGLNLGDSHNASRVRVTIATPSLFSMLGAAPERGRGFVEAEGKPGAPDVVLLSQGIWKRQFGGDTSIVGQSVQMNGIPHTVIGVMPGTFVFPSGTDVWIPMTVPFGWAGARREALRSYFLPSILVRLEPGVSAETAGKRVRALFEPYATAARPIEYGADELVTPLQQTLVKDRKTALWVLMGGALLVLLTAAANVTNLLLARASQRRREVGIRTALGASRRRIVQQLLTESLLLTACGAFVGIAFAYGALGVLTALMPAEMIDLAPPSLNVRVLLFTLGISISAGLVFGLWPAFGVTGKSAGGADQHA